MNNETDIGKIIPMLTGPIPDENQIWYQKHMCHNVKEESELSWINALKN